MRLKCIEVYGPLKVGQTYKMLEEGKDWYRIMCQGRPITVFKWALSKVTYNHEEISYEEWVGE